MNTLMDWVEDHPFILVVLGLVVFFCLTARIGQQFQWVSEAAEIEQLRKDSLKVDSKMAEDVAGQITAKNQLIMAKKTWRKTVFKLLIPSGWDTMEIIELPKQ